MLLGAAGCDAPVASRAGAQGRPERAETEAEVGREHVTLRARHEAGVPLHPGLGSRGVSGRLADGSVVHVVQWSEDRGWLEVRATDGTVGWITARYVASGAETARQAPSEESEAALESPSPRGVFSSRDACLDAVRSVAPRSDARVRIASWNLRWFPDGSSGGPSDQPTDVEWAACVLAALRVDAIGLQEILLHPRGVEALERLRAQLDRLTRGRWEAHFDACPRDGRQHVGWLVDTSRARVLEARQLDSVNPEGGCAHHLRPGLGVYARFRGGLDASLFVAHLDSGQAPRDHDHRAQSLVALMAEARAAAARHRDDDVLVLGDLNTMGCSDCAPAVSADAELAALDASLGSSMRRVEPSVRCTEFYRGRGSLLDHVLVTTRSRELPGEARVEVHGPCAEHRCTLPRGTSPAMLQHLSDHCPLVVELDSADRD
jgi:endonuclease/exonuclease/phosphatase family metal-dependent hydrolase